ncbi:MAG: hypothetical protein ABIH38_03890 [Patescibacteria group bacterium]
MKISQSAKDTAAIPAMTFSLATNIGNKTLCLPSNTLNKNAVVSYYYDVDGTPYYNSVLTQKAMTGKCTVNTQAYAPTNISAVTINPEYPPEVPNGFQMYFVRYDQTMMAYANKTFVPFESNIIAGGKSPLAISTGYYDAEKAEITVPARILLMETDLGFLNVCLPEQTITGTWADVDNRYFGKGATYYIDKNGTPYTDALLTKMATTKACDQLLANALTPRHIENAVVNKILEGIAEPNLVFSRNATWLGNIYLPTGNFDNQAPQPIDVTNANTPLNVILSHVNVTEQVFPELIVNITYTDLNETSQSLTLCVPATTIPGWEYSNSNNTSYFYDTNGTPYADALLENEVACGSCSDGILAGECNASNQYCDPGTMTLINNCVYCGYTCPSSVPYCNTVNGICEAKCSDGTAAGSCSGTQYCDPVTFTLKNVCDKCGYECEPGTGSKDIPVIAE